jgi:hypothetical protein
MNRLDFSELEQRLLSVKANPNQLVSSGFISSWLVEKFIDALKVGNQVLMQYIAECDDDLCTFMVGFTSETTNLEDNSLKSATGIIKEACYALLREDPLGDGSFRATHEQFKVIKDTFEFSRNPAQLSSDLKLDSHPFSYNTNPIFVEDNLHPAVLSKTLWSEKDVARFLITGATLDSDEQSFLHYQNIPDHIKHNPIIAGLNTYFWFNVMCLHSTITEPQAERDAAYGDKSILQVVQRIVPDRLLFCATDKDIAENPTGRNLTIGPAYYKFAEGILDIALALSHDDIVNGSMVDKSVLEAVSVAIDACPNIEKVAQIMEAQEGEWGSLSYSQIRLRKETPESIIKAALLESHIYNLCAKKIEQLASLVSEASPRETSDFLRTFTCLISSEYSYDGELLNSLTKNIKPVFAEALIGHRFDKIKALALGLINTADSLKSANWHEVQRFIHHAPVTVVHNTIMEISYPDAFLKAASFFHERCSMNIRKLAEHFMNRHENAIVDIFSKAESLSPGFGKEHDIQQAIKRFYLDRKNTYQRYLQEVEKPKLDTLTVPDNEEHGRADADMSFIGSYKI